MVAPVASPRLTSNVRSADDETVHHWQEYMSPSMGSEWIDRGHRLLRRNVPAPAPRIGARTAAAILDRLASQRTQQATAFEVAGFLQDLLGQQVTAVLAGVTQPRLVGRWARAEIVPSGDAERRLRAAFRAAWLVAQAESNASARAWLMGRSPYLSDRSPALVIADDAEDGPDRALDAARAYLAHG